MEIQLPDERGSQRIVTVVLPVSGCSPHSGKLREPPVPLERVFFHYLCQICGESAKEPILNILCGHLFCWRCIYMFSNTSNFGEQCPVCSAHLAISVDKKRTIISVHSGPKPGMYYCPSYESEDEEDEEEIQKEKEEAVSRRSTYVPRAPMYRGGAWCQSATMQVSWLIYHLGTTASLEVIPSLKCLCECQYDDVQFIADTVTLYMDRFIKRLQEEVQWALGQKKEHKNCSPKLLNPSTRDSEPLQQQNYEYNSRIYVWPTSEFPADCISFSCKICRKPAYEPIVTRCGHLYCWCCLYFNLRRNPEFNDVGYCPLCSLNVDIFDGCISVNPIYCGGGLKPEYEDILLVAGRRYIYEGHSNIEKILQAPWRPAPVSTCEFMPHVLKEYMKENAEIKNKFDALLNKRNNFEKDDVDHIARDMQDGLESLHKRLTEAWNKKLSSSQAVKRYHILEEEIMGAPEAKRSSNIPDIERFHLLDEEIMDCL